MKPTSRTLALLTVCAALGACAEDKPTPTPKPKTPKVELPALTAAAPARLHSILDTPVVPSSVAPSKADASTSSTALASKAASLEPGALTTNPADELKDLDCERSAAAPHVDRFVLAGDVKEREPVGETDTFSTESEKIWAFVQFDNELGEPFSVRVHWEKLDGPATPYGFVLDVPTAKRFRTWSWTAIRREPGQYKAVLRTLDGEELASRSFEIKAPDTLAQQ